MDCPHVAQLGYGAFARRLHERIGGQRVPLAGSLELTFRCNLRCVHCYVAHGHQGLPGKAELSTDEIRGILDQVTDEGCLWMLLTGGEPLVRPDFAEIYRYAKGKGLLVTLFTNGTLITPEIADLLAEWRPFTVEITLYGRTQATYERVTGVPGSHARCLRGIELLLERGVPLKLKTMLMTLNKHELGEMQAYAEGLGVEFRFDPMLNGALQASRKPQEYRLSPEEIVALELADEKRAEEWRSFCTRFRGVSIDGSRLFVCNAGVTTFAIDPYGHLSACLTARTPAFDLRRGDFHGGWHDFMAWLRHLGAGADFDCGRCELLPLCGQCPGWAQLEHGDSETPVEFLCQVAHRRAEAFGWRVADQLTNEGTILSWHCNNR